MRVDAASTAVVSYVVAILGAVRAPSASNISGLLLIAIEQLSFNGLSFLICSFTYFHRERNVFFFS